MLRRSDCFGCRRCRVDALEQSDPSQQSAFLTPLVNVFCCFHSSDSEGTFDTPEESPGVEKQLGELENPNCTGERATYIDGTTERQFPEVERRKHTAASACEPV